MLKVLAPSEEWQVIANGKTNEIKKLESFEGFENIIKVEKDTEAGEGELKFWLHTFQECPPISTYIYNMCAGQYDVIKDDDATAPVPMRIFLRNSKKDNIDAKEYFRVISTGIRFFEKLIGVKFPFEKYDSIFCPEYRIGAMENVGAITFNDGYLQPKDAQTELLRV